MTLAHHTRVSESPREYFRRHLRLHTYSPDDLVWYLDQAVPRFSGSDEVRLAVEELVDRLGGMLGFAADRGSRDEHAVWRSPTGAQLIVWVVDGERAVARVGSGAHVRERLLALTPALHDRKLTCLYVICGPSHERRLNDAVDLRRAWQHARLVTVDALVALGRHVAAGEVTHEQAAALLRPESALADGAIARLGPPGVKRD